MTRRLIGVVGALALLMSMSLPAFGDPVIESLLIRRIDDQVNIRVVVANPTDVTEPGPVITLYARPSDGADWTRIKTWNNIGYILPGNRVARDTFQDNNPALRAMAENGNIFQVKAVITGPGLHAASVEKTSQLEDPSGR